MARLASASALTVVPEAVEPDFEAAYASYFHPICAYLQRMIGNPDDAYDLSIASFEKAFRNWTKAPPDHVAPWLYRIATNTCLDELRRRKLIRWQPFEKFAAVFHPGHVSHDNPERDAIRGEQRAMLREALEKLNPRHRAALLMRECQGLSCEEVGEALGISKEAAKQLLFRARQHLRTGYTALGGNPSMAKVFYPPACDAELLSAYRDSALDTERRQRLETHLEGCPACRQELLRFEFLSATLLQLPAQTRPRPLSRTFRRQAPERPLPHRRQAATGAVAGAAMAALLFIVFFQKMPSHPSALFVAYPPAGASNVSTDTSIVLTFQGPVDQTQVQRTLRFEPPVPFDVAWDSDRRAEVLPLQPFAASTTYTLLAALPPVPTVSPPPSPMPGTLPAAAPQTLTVFHTAPVSADAGGPLPALSRSRLLRQQQVAGATQEVLSVPATPTPVTLPSAAVPPSRTLAPNVSGGAPELTSAGGKAAGASVNSPTTIGAALAESLERPALLPPCAPENLFTQLYSSRGDVRSALGCVVGPARAGTLVSQEFQRGILLALLPDNMLYELTADGIWSAAPLSAPAANGTVTGEERTVGPAFLPYWQAHTALRSRLGLPIGPQARSEALVQRFAHGRMLSSGDWLYVADDAGQWQRLVSPAPDGAGTPVAGGGAITGGVPSFPPMRKATAPTVTPAARQLAVAAASPRAAKAVLR